MLSGRFVAREVSPIPDTFGSLRDTLTIPGAYASPACALRTDGTATAITKTSRPPVAPAGELLPEAVVAEEKAHSRLATNVKKRSFRTVCAKPSSESN